jgi:hypothetical protein
VYTLPSSNDVYEFARELFLKAQVLEPAPAPLSHF